MLPALESSYNVAAESMDNVRRDLSRADVLGLKTHQDDMDHSGRIRAWCYVWMAAILEAYVGGILAAVIGEINSKRVPCDRLRVSLLSLLCSSDLDSLQQVRGLKMWDRRVETMNRVRSSTHIPLDANVLPLDGLTLRRAHFATIWNEFGFGGQNLPSPLHVLALQDLADGRNAVAHGHVDPAGFGRRKATGDALRLATQVEDIIVNLAEAADEYLRTGGYMR
jgi:hypothetical protein